MTEKQKRFADEYLVDRNGTRAYKAVYQSVKNEAVASSCAYKLLRNADIKRYIDEQTEQLHNERTADAAEVMEFLTEVMRDEGEGSVSRLKAAELLGKRYGMFTEKIDSNAPVTIVIKDDYGGE